MVWETPPIISEVDKSEVVDHAQAREIIGDVASPVAGVVDNFSVALQPRTECSQPSPTTIPVASPAENDVLAVPEATASLEVKSVSLLSASLVNVRNDPPSESDDGW